MRDHATYLSTFFDISVLHSYVLISQTNFFQGRVAAPDPFVVEVASGPLLFRQLVHGGPRLLGAARFRSHSQRLHSSQDFNRRLSFPPRIHQAAAGKQATSSSYVKAQRPG